jgi:hypothetical protein
MTDRPLRPPDPDGSGAESVPGEPRPEATVVPLEPTLRVDRPPAPGRAARAEVADGSRPTPPIRHDEPTVTIAGLQAKPLQRTLEFGAPAPVKVTVGPRVKPRRRFRTWPWIVAVIVTLLLLGAVLLAMLLNGETIDGDTDLVGSARSVAAGIAGFSFAPNPG